MYFQSYHIRSKSHMYINSNITCSAEEELTTKVEYSNIYIQTCANKKNVSELNY